MHEVGTLHTAGLSLLKILSLLMEKILSRKSSGHFNRYTLLAANTVVIN